MQKNNVAFKVADGQQSINTPFLFDRIIANLVLMATEDPEKMMKNFHELSTDSCLLGITIWGDQQYSNLLSIMSEAMEANKMEIAK